MVAQNNIQQSHIKQQHNIAYSQMCTYLLTA